MRQPEPPRYLAIGRVQRPHGIRGELRVEILTDYPERVAAMDHLYLGPDHQRYSVKGVRLHKNVLLLTLEGCADRDAAEALRGLLVEIAYEDAVPLEEGEYYHFQLPGIRVETEAGEFLGEIAEVFTVPGGNDVYVVHGPRGELLIPAIHDVVVDLDLPNQRLVIRPLPGLLS